MIWIAHAEQVLLFYLLRHVDSRFNIERMFFRIKTRIYNAISILDLSFFLHDLILVGKNANIPRFIQGRNIESLHSDVISLQIFHFLIGERSVCLTHISCGDKECKYSVGSFADQLAGFCF